MPATIPTHGDAVVSGGQMVRNRQGRGLEKSPPVYHREVTGEAHTCLMEEARGERCDGARVREGSHLGYLPEQAKVAVNGRHIRNRNRAR
jgi:hypothetical protein